MQASSSQPTGLPTRMLRPEPDAGSSRGALIAWIVIALVAGFITLSANPWIFRTRTPARSAAEAGAITSSAMLERLAQSVVGAPREHLSPDERDRLLNVPRLFARSPVDEARVAVLTAEVVTREEGLRQLANAALVLPTKGAEQARIDLELFDELTRGQMPAALQDRAQREAFRDRHGFFADLALSFAHPANDPQRQALLEQARRVYARTTGASLALLAGVIAGGVMFCVGLGLLLAGRITRALTPPTPGGSVYLEAFALFLLAFVGYSLGLGALADAGVEVPALVTSLGRWLLLLAALWPVVRGQRFRQTRVELGWHTGRGALRELAAGVLGYFAFLPVIALGVGITLVLRGLLDAPLPVHPIAERSSASGPFAAIDLYLLAAVWAPVVEETLFRGAFYRHLRGRWSVVASGLFSAFIFAAIHPQGLIAVPALMMIAFMLACLREWRSSLIAPVTAHALNNAAIVTILMLVS